MVADVWEKDIWEFQAKSGRSCFCLLFLNFLGKFAVQKMSGRTPGGPRHPSSRHPQASDTLCLRTSQRFGSLSVNSQSDPQSCYVFRERQFVHKIFVHNFRPPYPPSQPANDGFPHEFLLEGPQTELRTLSQNCEQTLQKLRTNRIMNKRAFLSFCVAPMSMFLETALFESPTHRSEQTHE